MRIRDMVKLVAGAGLLGVVVFGMTQAGSPTKRSDGVILDEGEEPVPSDGRRHVGDAREILEKKQSELSDPLS